MIPTEFDYKRADSLDAAIAMLADGEAKLLAGGHSLIPLMKLRLSEPGTLIDIARIPGLSGISEKGDKIEIGATTVHHDVATSSLLQQKAPVVAEAAAEIGDPQVRNRGTLGGSLAHADPAADMPAVMVAIDAEIHLKGPNGWRAVKAEDFFQDIFTVDMAENEIIAGVQFAPIAKAAYAKLHQRASHYAIVGVCAALQVNGNTCTSARVAITGASHARTAAHRRRERTRRQGAHAGQHRRRRRPRRPGPHRRELRHPRQRGLPPRHGEGLHAPRHRTRRRALDRTGARAFP